ncbi:hypothetical protein DFA_10230 [Cavenderia fasciculata]|uniref:Uncharacterized protein n=1 Tax=Cavenderia fasciculata TaxID=261658 RepID=F4Q9M7_CACFS|nr:uncharacterized protein DFA_10230 [Cavenderia fasciculata]EGG15396.1 hypothetical protein DFA_10230 [Cavenderia fasciculata]|eukprot:XP_004354138.1 hypothetical protein DFA_10230 [Cavenderia fasciculata]
MTHLLLDFTPINLHLPLLPLPALLLTGRIKVYKSGVYRRMLFKFAETTNSVILMTYHIRTQAGPHYLTIPYQIINRYYDSLDSIFETRDVHINSKRGNYLLCFRENPNDPIPIQDELNNNNKINVDRWFGIVRKRDTIFNCSINSLPNITELNENAKAEMDRIKVKQIADRQEKRAQDEENIKAKKKSQQQDQTSDDKRLLLGPEEIRELWKDSDFDPITHVWLFARQSVGDEKRKPQSFEHQVCKLLCLLMVMTNNNNNNKNGSHNIPTVGKFNTQDYSLRIIEEVASSFWFPLHMRMQPKHLLAGLDFRHTVIWVTIERWSRHPRRD